MYWYDRGHMNGWGWTLMTAGTVAFWAVVITGIVLLVRYLSRTDRPGGRDQWRPTAPDQLLAERFARGQIDEDEYRRRLETLRATGTDASLH